MINRWVWNNHRKNRQNRQNRQNRRNCENCKIDQFDVLEFEILKWFISFTANAVAKGKEWFRWRKKKIFRWCRKFCRIKKKSDCSDSFYFFHLIFSDYTYSVHENIIIFTMNAYNFRFWHRTFHWFVIRFRLVIAFDHQMTLSFCVIVCSTIKTLFNRSVTIFLFACVRFFILYDALFDDLICLLKNKQLKYQTCLLLLLKFFELFDSFNVLWAFKMFQFNKVLCCQSLNDACDFVRIF